MTYHVQGAAAGGMAFLAMFFHGQDARATSNVADRNLGVLPYPLRGSGSTRYIMRWDSGSRIISRPGRATP